MVKRADGGNLQQPLAPHETFGTSVNVVISGNASSVWAFVHLLIQGSLTHEIWSTTCRLEEVPSVFAALADGSANMTSFMKTKVFVLLK